jgi:hypothetical protein
VFTDDERNNEFALSFLVPEGREVIWKQIKMFQLQNQIDIPQPTVDDLPKLNPFIRKYSSSTSSGTFLYQRLMKNNYFDQFLVLPREILGLEEDSNSIEKYGAPLSIVPFPFAYSTISLASFLESVKLEPLSPFQKQSLSFLFSAIRDLFLMNDASINNYLFSLENDRLKKVIDCLEYDESIDTRIPHNRFIRENVRFYQV